MLDYEIDQVDQIDYSDENWYDFKKIIPRKTDIGVYYYVHTIQIISMLIFIC